MQDLSLWGNELRTLPVGGFDGLTALETLELTYAGLRTLPVGVFDGLTALQALGLSGNELGTLPAGVFDGLTALQSLGLRRSELRTLPAGVFSGLTALQDLSLWGNELRTLPVGVFDGLTALQVLDLSRNELGTLSAGVFDGLTALNELHLADTGLETLPAGVFDGLTGLDTLDLTMNPGSPLPLTVSLASVAHNGEVRATTHTAAPFAFEVPLSVTNGTINGCAVFAPGSSRSSVFTVARTPDSADPVTIDIGALPGLPPNHSGYVLEKDSGLPLQVPEPVHTLPLVTPASNAAWQGFVRIVNRSARAGMVRIHAIDDSGRRFGPVFLSLEAQAAVQFNSGDLETGNSHKGLSGGVGEGEGNWRLELDADFDIKPLAYVRAADGFVTSIHEVVAEDSDEEGVMRYGVPIFNPGSNHSQQSRLRLINPDEGNAEVVIRGRDARGEWAPGGEVRLALPAGGARMLSAQELERGGAGFDGRLGDGAGKWRLSVSADRPLQVMNLLLSPTGNLTNLSSTSLDPGGGRACEGLPSSYRRVGGALSPETQRVARAASPERKVDSPNPPIAFEIVLPSIDTAGGPPPAETGEIPPVHGVHRDVPGQFRGDLSSRLNWIANDDGTLVSTVLATSPEAIAMRMGIRADLVVGGEIRFFAEHTDRHRRFPVITRADFYQEGDKQEILWSPIVDGDTIGMEITLPSREALPGFSVNVERLSHIHVPMKSLGHAPEPRIDTLIAKSHNDAHIDVQCRTGKFPPDLDSAVAIVRFEHREGYSAGCTGTLLNDKDEGSFIPYFLTAEHCVGTEAEARSAEFEWFYQAAACGSDTIDNRYHVTYGGADLLASNQYVDIALLRLKRPPPGGVWYSGWSAVSIRPPLEVYGIHHPRLGLKSYVSSTLAFVKTDGVQSGRIFLTYPHHEGDIQSGSSGSGIFDREYLLGTAIYPNEYSYFPRFYPQVRRWLDTDPSQPDHTLPLVMSAANDIQQGFVRIINRSARAGTVRIHAIDDSGQRFGPVFLSLEAEAAVQFNSDDLETGNSHKGLSGGVGDGEGNWRLALNTELDIEPLAYIRTRDGSVTSIHDVAAEDSDEDGVTRYRLPIFNPGSNRSQQSRLRLINPGEGNAEVVIRGRDARGEWAPGGEVRLALPAGRARVLSAQELERGGAGFDGRLGDGAGKWRLSVSADRPLQVMNLLLSPTGSLSNLSR